MMILARKAFMCPDFEETQVKLHLLTNLHRRPPAEEQEKIAYHEKVFQIC